VTPIRKSILNLLQKEEKPLSAAQVYRNTVGKADLATIYRGLQYLEKKAFLDSFVFACNCKRMERYYIVRSEAHKHYLHCSDCHNFFPINDCPLSDSIYSIEDKYHFKVNYHFLTFVGFCENCR